MSHLFATWLAIVPLAVFWHWLIELPGIALGKRIARRFEAKTPVTAPTSNAAGAVMNSHRNSIRTAAIFCGLVVATYAAMVLGSPADPATNNNSAWAYATSPDAAKRNGSRAVRLAKIACTQTQYTNTTMVGTLAAAYAEAGQYTEALLAAQRACAMAQAQGETNLLRFNQELMTLYETGRPYHEEPR